MKMVLHKSNLGIVLDVQSSSGDDHSRPSAQLILNRYLLDDEGNICLSAPVECQGVTDLVDSLKTELDGLADATLFWLAQNIAFRRATQFASSNDNQA